MKNLIASDLNAADSNIYIDIYISWNFVRGLVVRSHLIKNFLLCRKITLHPPTQNDSCHLYLSWLVTVHLVTKESAPATFIAGAELETLLPLSELLSSQHSLCCCCTERSWRSHLAEYVL